MSPQLEQIDDLSRIKIGDQLFNFRCFLVNPEKRFFIIKPDAIKNLTILDNFNKHYISGSLTITNTSDLIERPAVLNREQQAAASSYLFRGDARDILRVSISPVLQPNKTASSDSDKVKSLLTLDFEFAIYNIEELPGDSPGSKYKKLYFHELYYQILLEKNTDYATRGEVKTGIAIKELLQNALPVSDGFSIKYENFDEGGTTINFSSPAKYKAQDCLDYLLDRHVSTQSNNFDPCRLSYTSSPPTFTFMSLSTYFKNAYLPGAANAADAGGPLFLEKFYLGGFKNTNTGIDTVIERSPTIAVFLAKQSTIDNFVFLPPPGQYTQQEVVPRLVHSYQPSEGMFSVDVKANSFATAAKVYQQNYVAPMKGDQGAPSSNLTGNQYRSDRKNVHNVFSTSYNSAEQRLGVGRNKFLTSAVLFNNAISFRVPGATYRSTGKFISIDRQDAVYDSEFDDKSLGIYLLVDVKHIFNNGTYVNDIIAIKTYNYKSVGFTGEGYI